MGLARRIGQLRKESPVVASGRPVIYLASIIPFLIHKCHPERAQSGKVVVSILLCLVWQVISGGKKVVGNGKAAKRGMEWILVWYSTLVHRSILPQVINLCTPAPSCICPAFHLIFVLPITCHPLIVGRKFISFEFSRVPENDNEGRMSKI